MIATINRRCCWVVLYALSCVLQACSSSCQSSSSPASPTKTKSHSSEPELPSATCPDVRLNLRFDAWQDLHAEVQVHAGQGAKLMPRLIVWHQSSATTDPQQVHQLGDDQTCRTLMRGASLLYTWRQKERKAPLAKEGRYHVALNDCASRCIFKSKQVSLIIP